MTTIRRLPTSNMGQTGFPEGGPPLDRGEWSEEMSSYRAGLGIGVLLSLAIQAGPVQGQESSFSWNERMTQGQVLEVKGIVGDINVAFTSGAEAEVVAVKRGEENDFHQVAIEVAEAGDRIIICAVYGSWNHGEGRCHPDHKNEGDDDEGRNRDVDMDVKVDYEVRLPAGIEFKGVVVSGDVHGEGLRSDVSLTTVDGDVFVSTSERAWANTVSGDMEIEMGEFGGEDLDFNSVSGDITLWVPANFSADVDFNSLSGDFETDLEMSVTREKSKWIGSSIEGTIGGGGRDLSFSTVSGDVSLLRRR
jgi:hypothetical protein